MAARYLALERFASEIHPLTFEIHAVTWNFLDYISRAATFRVSRKPQEKNAENAMQLVGASYEK